MLVTDVCGYAHYIDEANAGRIRRRRRLLGSGFVLRTPRNDEGADAYPFSNDRPRCPASSIPTSVTAAR